jgi:hypothetical protein
MRAEAKGRLSNRPSEVQRQHLIRFPTSQQPGGRKAARLVFLQPAMIFDSSALFSGPLNASSATSFTLKIQDGPYWFGHAPMLGYRKQGNTSLSLATPSSQAERPSPTARCFFDLTLM